MPSLTYTPGRFGQWITYQDNKTIQEMLFSGEAREAYLDSFLSGFALGFPSAGIDTVLLENRGYSGKAADAALDIPAPAAPVGALADGGLRGVKALSDGKTPDVSTAAADGGARAAEILKNQAQTPSAPRAQLNGNVRAQTSLTPQLQADMQASDRAADTVSNSADAKTDIRTDTEAVPVRYEDALRDYLESGLDFAAEPDAGRSPSSGTDALQSAELNSDLVLSQDAAPETTQEAVPKTKEQLISELAPKISKPGITPGRAIIEAQRLYAEVEQRYGENAEVILEQFESGQNPRKFLDGFQNAYIAGKLDNKATLENSTAAAYLTEEQRSFAFELGKSGIQNNTLYSEGDMHFILENDAPVGTIKRGNVDVRRWYIEAVTKIPEMVDMRGSEEQRARQAFDLRNKIRTTAREMMEDQELRAELDSKRPNKSFEELVESKIRRKGMTREEAIRDIFITATKTNENVNNELGLGR